MTAERTRNEGRGPTIGIDLGTTNSCAAVYRDGRAQVLINARGERTTPSVVTFPETDDVLVGAPARRQAVMNPKRTISAIKRLVGRRYDSEESLVLRATAPYHIVRAPSGDAWAQVGARTMSPPEVQSYVLEEVCRSAAASLGAPVARAVVTVPAYFDEAQRQATRDAATIADLDVVRILNEPTAAALAYGHGQSQGKCLAVVDLGGGTFDVTVMMVEDGVFEVLATTGDMLLGGDDFDHAVAMWFADEIRAAHGVDVLADAVATQRLLIEVEEAKKQLSAVDRVVIGMPFLAVGPVGPVNFERSLTRQEVEERTAHLSSRLEEPCHRALADAGLARDQIEDVLLVGGMTRWPAVQQRIAAIFGRRPSLKINPDEAVALGAALESAILDGALTDTALIDVAPHTIGLRVAGDRMVPLIRRATTLPTRVTKLFSTHHDDQEHVDLEVLQGDDPVASRNRRLSRMRLEGLPKAPKGAVRVAVTFAVDADGLLSVSAREKETGRETAVTIVAESGLTRAQVEELAGRRHAERQEDSR